MIMSSDLAKWGSLAVTLGDSHAKANSSWLNYSGS